MRWLRDVGGVLVAWAVLIVVEFVVVGAAYRGLFAGNWELILGRKLVAPIALAMLAPAAVVLVATGRLVHEARTSRAARIPLGIVGALAAGAVGVGVTHGRHFESVAVRLPFVAVLAAVGASVTLLLPRASRVFAGDRGRMMAVVAGVGGAALAWFVDGHVLVRLYPAFHVLAFAAILASAAVVSLAWRAPGTDRVLGALGLGLAIAASVWAPFAASRLARADNLRLVLEEHAPLLGRAVRVSSWLSPPPPIEPDDTASLAPVAEVPRALDWSGRDILLVSVDALRADHLSAYGYARATTPNLDALAKESALFERAYCPTPHTSYSVTSMMTGKAMRPLLALGLGEESDTWATYLRRYGYKTAAFYPPAVFYIDAPRFTRFEETGLGFEYRWVEFTTADEKVREVEKYLTTAGPAPVFLWVHLFEPHEPYVMHPSHPFAGGSPPSVDAYDSEVAYADSAIGDLLRVVRAARPSAIVIVTADHGEEFGDHGGRYHGTTCYEEQVRVPLLVSGPGIPPRRVPTVVQTIDLLPTVLGAVGIPRPARVRGRDLGPVLANAKDEEHDPGLAYAETDEQTLLARGDDRLLCTRSVAACALYDIGKDPGERTDRAPQEPGLTHELRALTAGIEREQGRYEAAAVAWPDALRRGLQGEADAAEDVAALLDDANVVIRRKAAEVTAELAVATVAPQVRRAYARDEDEEVKRWSALALVRMGDPPSDLAQALVRDPDVRWRRAASLAFALGGDGRGRTELATYWRDEGAPRAGLDVRQSKELLTALARIRDTEAVPALIASLDYVPLRPKLAETLGIIGDVRARGPLLALFEHERYETARPDEAKAVVALGGGHDLAAPLALFAGLPDPMTDAIGLARDAHVLDAAHGGFAVELAIVDVDARVSVPAGVALRLWVLAGSVDGELSGSVAGVALGQGTRVASVHFVDLAPSSDASVHLTLHEPSGIRAVWVVPRQMTPPPFLVPHEPDAGAGAHAGG